LTIARGELGVREKPGAEHSARILEYHAATKLKATSDEVAWCSSFCNWVMQQAGIEGTGSAAARSWLSWGVELERPRVGCIVVLKRGDNPAQGHVALWLSGHEFNGYMRVLGGNQSGRVCVSRYLESRLISYRWPVGVP